MSSATPPPRARKLNALTSLRFIAAALVVVVHSGGYFGLPREVGYPFRFGLAVSFFFVLSGFILTYVYPSLREIGRRRFLWARVARIWPGHLFAIVLMLALLPALAHAKQRFDWAGILSNVFMIQTWAPLDRGRFFDSLNPPSWSIATEFAFYLCFIVLIPAWRKTWWVKLLATLAIVAGVIALCDRLPLAKTQPEGVTEYDLLYRHPLPRLFEFTLGMSTALLWRWWTARKVRIKPLLGTALELAALAAAALAMGNSLAVANAAAGVAWIGPHGANWLVYGGFPCVPFAILIAVMACETGWISRLLGIAPFALLGEISYSVYLIHVPVLRYYDANLHAFDWIDRSVLYAMFWLLILCGSHLVWLLVERPCRVGLVTLWPAKVKTSPKTVTITPGFRLIARTAVMTEVLVVLTLVYGAYYCTHLRSNVLDAPGDEIARSVEQTLPESRDVRFGDRLVLLGATPRFNPAGMNVKLIWRSEQSLELNGKVQLQLFGNGAALLSQLTLPQDVRPTSVKPGATWANQVTVPLAVGKLSAVRAIGVTVLDANARPLPVDRGRRSANGGRLLLVIGEDDSADVQLVEDPDEVKRFAADAIPESRNVRFGDGCVLLGATIKRDADGSTSVKSMWRSTRAQALEYSVANHLLDSSGTRIGGADHAQDWLKGRVRPGDVWVDDTKLPALKSGDARRLGIALYSTSGGQSRPLPVDRGPRDWDNRRLLLPLPTR